MPSDVLVGNVEWAPLVILALCSVTQLSAYCDSVLERPLAKGT